MKDSRLGPLVALTLSLVAAPLAAMAPPTSNLPRVGYVFATTSSAGHRLAAAARQALRELGYVKSSPSPFVMKRSTRTAPA